MSRRTISLALLALAASCTPAASSLKSPIEKVQQRAVNAAPLPGPPGLPAASLATLQAADQPVAFAASEKGGLFAFVQDGKLFAKPFAAGPAASGEPSAIGPVSAIGVAFSVRARPDGTFVAFWDERVDQNHVFKLQRLGADAKPLGPVLTFAPIAEAGLSFADVAVTGDRLVVVHQVSRGERLSVYATAVSAAGDKVEGSPKLVLDGVLSWFPAESEAGIGFIAVRDDSRSEDPTIQRGTLDFVSVSKTGQVGATKPVLGTPTARIDAQIVAIAGGYVVAWTDESQGEGAVRVLTLGADGALASQPTWIAPPIGQQAFVTLSVNPHGRGARALVAWENVGHSSGESRIIQMASVGAKGAIGSERTRLLYEGPDSPAIVADGEGFAALTLAPTTSDPNAEPSPYPTLVRLGADLGVRWAEPVRFSGVAASDGVPEFAFNLSCAGGSCYALATEGTTPASFFVVGAAERENPWKAPAWREEDERPPKVLALRSVAEGPRLAAAMSTRLGADRSATDAVAWVTYFMEGTTPSEPAPKGEPPYAAALGIRFTKGDGTLTEPLVVSKRALSLGGVGITPSSGAKKNEAVVAWVANDKTGPQVYATKVDSDGKKVAQKKVTSASRDVKKGKGASSSDAAMSASSVAIAGSVSSGKDASEGYVVAWVDTRDKNGEVYAARLDKDLEKSGPDKRITSSAGDASDVSLVVRGNDAFMAFADSRDGKSSDIYFAHLDATSLKKIDDDGRVYASAGRSRAPRLVLAGSKILIAWIEEGASETAPATLRLAEVDATGRLGQAPQILQAPGTAGVTGFTLTCGADVASCRLALSWSTADGRTEIGAATLNATGTLSAITRLGTLASGPFAEPAFSFTAADATRLFYAEDLGETGRLRELSLTW